MKQEYNRQTSESSRHSVRPISRCKHLSAPTGPAGSSRLSLLAVVTHQALCNSPQNHAGRTAENQRFHHTAGSHFHRCLKKTDKLQQTAMMKELRQDGPQGWPGEVAVGSALCVHPQHQLGTASTRGCVGSRPHPGVHTAQCSPAHTPSCSQLAAEPLLLAARRRADFSKQHQTNHT